MLIATGLWSEAALTVMTVIQFAVLLIALRWVPWRLLLAVPAHSHLLFAVMVGLAFLWQMNGHFAPPVRLHLLGMTSAALILGAPLAIVAGTVASFGLVVSGGLELSEAMAHALINAAIPALITAGLLRAVMRFGPRNLFMYMLGVGFVGGALSMLGAMLATLVLLTAIGQHASLPDGAAAIALLVIFPEGFVNGTMVTMLAVYYPQWLKTFDDRHFLDGV